MILIFYFQALQIAFSDWKAGSSCNCMVVSSMFARSRKQVQILRSIIVFGFVYMVDCLFRIKESSYNLFCSDSVLKNVSTAITMRMVFYFQKPIALFVFFPADSRFYKTFCAAKLFLFKLALVSHEYLSAKITICMYMCQKIRVCLANFSFYLFAPRSCLSACSKNSKTFVTAKLIRIMKPIYRSVMEFLTLNTWDIFASKFIRTHEYEFIFVRQLMQGFICFPALT